MAHWFVPTEFSAASAALRTRQDLAAPRVILIETANTLYKSVRRGTIRRDEAALAPKLLELILADIVPDRHLLSAAIELALSYLHPVYDCLYLALALERRDTLATADKRLATLAEQAGASTLLIRSDA